MGKYSLGSASTVVNGVDKNNLYLNDNKAKKVVNDLYKQLDAMSASLINVHLLLNQCVACGMVKGVRVKTYKAWARKAKSQANAIDKLKESIHSRFEDDLRNYPLKLLDDRIAELERRIASMSQE